MTSPLERNLANQGTPKNKVDPTVGWCRKLVNQRTGRLRRLFKWAVSEQLLPVAVYEALRIVDGLKQGRCQARESEPVKPVPEALVLETLPYLRPPVAAMAQLQLLTGMRPGEVVIMRAIDLDMTGTVWLYRPGSDRGPHGAHKTAWRGHDRIIAIGPRGQEVIKPFLKTDLYAYLFSPADSMQALWAEQRAKRKTKVQPSQANRKKRKAKKQPGERYTVLSYDRAVTRACLRANVPHWHPNRLRHTKATELRREAGIDAARVVLGHRSPRVTEVYAEIDAGKAAEIMGKLG
jgi:integrase